MANDGGAGARILVVAPSWVGDLVMAQPLFADLRANAPDARIDAVAPPATHPLLTRIPEVSRALLLPVRHGELGLGSRRELARALRAERYHLAVVLPNSFKSALLPWLAGIPHRRGWRGEMRYGLLNEMATLEEARFPLMADRYRALATARFAAPGGGPARPRLANDTEGLPALLEKLGLSGERPLLALCPGAEFGPAKRWPAEHFAAVAARFLAADWQVCALGAGADRRVTGAVRDALPAGMRAGFADLAGRTTLPEVVDLIAAAHAVLSNDSGLMHIATAVATPVWVVYGSSSPTHTPPLSDEARVLWQQLECSPCYRRECPLGHLNCLRQLFPEQVLDSMGPLLAAGASAPGSAPP